MVVDAGGVFGGCRVGSRRERQKRRGQRRDGVPEPDVPLHVVHPALGHLLALDVCQRGDRAHERVYLPRPHHAHDLGEQHAEEVLGLRQRPRERGVLGPAPRLERRRGEHGRGHHRGHDDVLRGLEDVLDVLAAEEHEGEVVALRVAEVIPRPQVLHDCVPSPGEVLPTDVGRLGEKTGGVGAGRVRRVLALPGRVARQLEHDVTAADERFHDADAAVRGGRGVHLRGVLGPDNLWLWPRAVEELAAEKRRDGAKGAEQHRPVLRVRDFPAPLKEHGEHGGEERVPQEGVAKIRRHRGKSPDGGHDPHQLDGRVNIVVRLGELALHLPPDHAELREVERVAHVEASLSLIVSHEEAIGEEAAATGLQPDSALEVGGGQIEIMNARLDRIELIGLLFDCGGFVVRIGFGLDVRRSFRHLHRE